METRTINRKNHYIKPNRTLYNNGNKVKFSIAFMHQNITLHKIVKDSYNIQNIIKSIKIQFYCETLTISLLKFRKNLYYVNIYTVILFSLLLKVINGHYIL